MTSICLAIWLLLALPALADPQLRRVVLSSGGVGQFEFEGEVDGAAVLPLDVKLDQVDDVLKSLVVDDPAGPSAGARLPGRQPLSESFRALPFQQDAFASAEALLAGLVGERVRLPGKGVEGAILAVSPFHVPGPGVPGGVTRHRLTIATAAGIDSAVLEDTPDIEFVSDRLRADIATALAAIAAQRVQDRRTVILTLAPGSKRLVRFSYVVQVPVWKTSYRLILPPEGAPEPAELQAFAVVENLSGRDWKDVSVVLTSGRPALFRTPLYQAIFADRPEAPVDVPGALAPPVDSFAAQPMLSEARRFGSITPVQRGIPPPAAAAPAAGQMALDAPQFAKEPPAELAQSVAQVEFRLSTPVTAASGQSMLLPILDRPAPAQRVSLFDQGTNNVHPLVAVKLTNDSAGALPPGLVSLFEKHGDGTTGYLGDARLPAIEPGEDRLASFAVDLGVSVDVQETERSVIASAAASRGTLTLVTRTQARTVYKVTTPKSGGRTMLIQQPRERRWSVTEPIEGVSLTPDMIRVTRDIAAGATTDIAVATEMKTTETRDMLSEDDSQLDVLAMNTDIPPPLHAAMQQAVALRDEVTRRKKALEDLHSREAGIVTDQGRVRDNLRSVPADSELQRRYLATLQGQEDDLDSLRQQEASAEKQAAAAQDALKTYLSNLTL
jgi:hypothetical protein